MKRVILLLVLILLISSGVVFAEVPCKINYQGRLIKDNVPVDGTKTMVFSIYAVATGGSSIWTSGNVSVEVHNGLFRYVIGSDGGDLSGMDWTAGQALYLQVMVDGETLTPREELSAYPYAINSHLLEGKTIDDFLNTSGDTQKKDGELNIMGNVGIGTTSPGAKLDVAGTSYLQKLLTTGNNIYSSADPKAADIVIGSDTGTRHDSSMMFWSAASAVRLLSQSNNLYFSVCNQDAVSGANVKLAANSGGTSWFNGNVGIGTTSPGAKLDVQGGAIKATGGLIIETRTSDPTSPATGQTWLRTDINP